MIQFSWCSSVDTLVVYELCSWELRIPAFNEEKITLMYVTKKPKWNVLESGKESSGVPQLSICVKETCFLAYQSPLEKSLKGLSFQLWYNSFLYCLPPSAPTHKRLCPFISIRKTQYTNILNKTHFLTAQRLFFITSSTAL